ncbi:MAG: hypothetical protein LN561_02045, partial [Rickettsia endosymbiont of Labidopullus appendiculatus]|nr:hypothetical protein [Rickettsia endosymbiont of Labidopullus appendiculatus]
NITESKYDDGKKDLILKALKDASDTHGLVTNGGINITAQMLEKISFEDIAYALNHKEEFAGLLDEVNLIIGQWDYDTHNSNKFKKFVLSFNNNSSFKPKFIEVPYIESDNILALSIKTGINISKTPEKDSQKKLLIKALYDQIKENNVNNLTEEELDQFVKKACDEAKSTDGFSMKHTHALRILSKFDFSKIDEEYSCIQKQLTNSYEKQEITSEYYHLQQEGLHFYLVKVTGKNAEMWQKYASYQKNGILKNGIKLSDGIAGFLSSIDYHDQNDVWVALVSDKPLSNLNNIMDDRWSIEMFVTMMTSEDAHFTSHAGITRASYYIGEYHKNLACKLHSFIATITLQHYGKCEDILNTVNKDYMITVPITAMRTILIKAFKDVGQEANIFIGDNTTECSNKTLQVLTKKIESMKSVGHDKSERTIGEYNEAQLALDIKQQQETLKKEGVSVPIEVTKGEGYNECLNWILRSKAGEVLDNFKPQDMKGKQACFFEHQWLWKNNSHKVPAVTCNLEALVDMGHFNTPFEHEYTVETIGDSPLFPLEVAVY